MRPPPQRLRSCRLGFIKRDRHGVQRPPRADQGNRAMSVMILWATQDQSDELRMESIYGQRRGVVDFVAVKASKSNIEPQLSIRWPQRIQSKTVISTQFQQTSINT
jgi:hypothetical protein